jgi:hypothetical protein
VADGPVSTGCPGEPLSPVELFLSGVASCGVELIQVLAHHRGIPLTAVHTTILSGVSDRRPETPDVALFSAVRIYFTFGGVTTVQGNTLIEGASAADRYTARSELQPPTYTPKFTSRLDTNTQDPGRHYPRELERVLPAVAIVIAVSAANNLAIAR